MDLGQEPVNRPLNNIVGQWPFLRVKDSVEIMECKRPLLLRR